MNEIIQNANENRERSPIDPEGFAKLPPEQQEALVWLVGELEKGINCKNYLTLEELGKRWGML